MNASNICKMQTACTRTWTQDAVSISYDNIYYNVNASKTLCEMQTAFSMIRNRDTVSISYDDIHYTLDSSKTLCIY